MTSTIRDGIQATMGDTPLVYIKSLSEATGCRILAKMEFLNPGGSIKDRTAKGLLIDAEKNGKLKPGDTIVEGTDGSTGVGLALLAAARGYKCVLYAPDQNQEKIDLLRACGAEVNVVPSVTFHNPNHFCHQARFRASKYPDTYFLDQFDNLSNFDIHYKTTGPEIWEQSGKNLDYFVAAAGTGGTIAGVSCYLKEQNSNIGVYLIDPPGSVLFNYITRGELESDGRDTVIQGVGIVRETTNFSLAKIDGALMGEDREVVEMMHFLLKNDGIFSGSSGALNLVGAVRLAQKFGPGKTIITVIPDGGQRYIKNLYDPDYLKKENLIPRATRVSDFIQQDDSKIVPKLKK